MNSNHDEFIHEHAQDLGMLKADVGTLKQGQTVLFGKVDSLEQTASKLVEGFDILKTVTYAILTVSILAFLGMMFNYVSGISQ